MQPKIIIGTPTSIKKDYCLIDFLAHAAALTYPAIEHVIVDNSPGKEYAHKLRSYGVKVLRVPNKGNKSPQELVADSHNLLRTYALDKGADYLFHLESDIIPPVDVIERLLDAESLHDELAVFAGMYFLGHGGNSRLMYNVDWFKTGSGKGHGKLDFGSLDLDYADGGIKKVGNAGLGAMLIHKEILANVPFRHVTNSTLFPDALFALDLANYGIPVYVDTSIHCLHHNTDWDSNYEFQKNLTA